MNAVAPPPVHPDPEVVIREARRRARRRRIGYLVAVVGTVAIALGAWAANGGGSGSGPTRGGRPGSPSSAAGHPAATGHQLRMTQAQLDRLSDANLHASLAESWTDGECAAGDRACDDRMTAAAIRAHRRDTSIARGILATLTPGGPCHPVIAAQIEASELRTGILIRALAAFRSHDDKAFSADYDNNAWQHPPAVANQVTRCYPR
jgi:hypothetical protein